MYRHGQISYTAGAAMATYFGDLKDNPTDLWAKPSIQLGAQYRYNNHLYFRTEVLWYRISGADSLNGIETTIKERNLSFRADNFEWNVQVMYQLFNKYARYNRPTLNPYVFIGAGLTTNNPKAYYEGDATLEEGWYALRPIQTEERAYSPVAIVFPAGIGVTYHINSNWDVSAEYGYRVTFNDFLDDVSTFYPDKPHSELTPMQQVFTDRRPEIGLDRRRPGYPYRGNSKNDDWYLITGLKVTYSPGPDKVSRYKKPKYRGRRR